jgi:hypothetical protein
MTDLAARGSVDTELEIPGGPHTRPNEPAEGSRWPGQVPQGEPVAPTTEGWHHHPDSVLPPGVHPNDPSGPDEPNDYMQEARTPHRRTGQPPFSVDNEQAFATFERASHDWRGGVVVVDGNSTGTAIVVGRRPGRKHLYLWTPSVGIVVGGALVVPAAGNGVLVAGRQGELEQGGGFILNVGDPRVDIESEGEVWVGLIPGQAIGYVQYLDLFDIPGSTAGSGQ